MEKIKISDVIKEVEKHAPPLDCEPYAFYGADREYTNGVAVCVDPAIEVMKEAKEREMGMIVAHHYPSNRSAKYAAENGLYLMVVHLAQDAASEGNIDCFAKLIGVKNIEPFTIRYKKMIVPHGAVTGDFGRYFSLNGFLDYVFSPAEMKSAKNPCRLREDISDAMRSYDLMPRIKIFEPKNARKEIKRVGVSTGAAIKPEFLEQIAAKNIDAYIAAEMEQPAVMVAEELGIVLVDAGHYETEVPGMVKLSMKIGRIQMGAMFIPNKYNFR
ncbi:MAG: Nif3-like dinuclear metal center hexameric protein [Nanoarchaeota archaeon]|nr:Nif3-like dinuclear metal center hexameric protein [Nanoarchaeota archaeon]